MEIATRLEIIKGQIRQTLESVRQPERSVKLVLVTKTVPVERVQEAYDLGMRDFGENRIQEWLPKARALPDDIHWHFIGRLQKNKVKHLVDFALSYPTPIFLQSLDSEDLASEIERVGKARGLKALSCLLQINTTGEKTKAGFSSDEVSFFLKKRREYSILQVEGLMTIGPLTSDETQIRTAFRSLKALQEKLKAEAEVGSLDFLSMGMSLDYQIAIEEGANIIRIGTAVFGERNE